jgi:hypothetical protein
VENVVGNQRVETVPVSGGKPCGPPAEHHSTPVSWCRVGREPVVGGEGVIEGLSAGEQAVLERASISGAEFPLGALVELLPPSRSPPHRTAKPGLTRHFPPPGIRH